MKYLILIIISIAFFNCKAQTIARIDNSDGYGEEGFYYKDVYNDFNTFVGTWVYSNGSNTSLKITFKKKLNNHEQDEYSNFHYDALVGEYLYIENGIERINTLQNLLNDYSYPFDYNLVGISIKKYGDPNCTNCEPENKMVKCSFSQPDCDIISSPKMIFRYYIENGIEKLYLNFRGGPIVGNPDGIEPQCQNYAIPFGSYTLIKEE